MPGTATINGGNMAYYDDIVQYLTDGYWEQSGRTRRKFDVEPGGTLTVNITGLTPEGQYLARVALDSWTLVSGIHFQEVSHNNAHIMFDDNEDDAGSISSVRNGIIIQSHVNISTDWLNHYGTGLDSYSFSTYLHEIGHALGLGHPGPYNGHFPDFLRETISFDESWQVTVMSYIDQTRNIFNPGDYAHVVTPMIADIAAIHELYGTPDNVHGSNTRYGYRPNTGTHMDDYFELWTGEGNPFHGIDFSHIHQPQFMVRDGEIRGMIALSSDRTTALFYRNEGNPGAPNFVYDVAIEGPPPRIEDFEFVDMTGDGESDLVISTFDSLVIAPSSAVSTEDFIVIPSDQFQVRFDVVDIDGDGDQDIIEVDWDKLYFRENIGTARRPDIADSLYMWTFPDPVSDFVFEDIDNDNDYDLVVSTIYGALVIIENDGTPRRPSFQGEVHYYDNPLQSSRYGEFPLTIMRDIAFVDLDSDNDLDLVIVDNIGNVHYFDNTGTSADFHFSPTSFNRGTTFTIYDTGGTDWLDVRTDKYDQWIDLNEGQASSVYNVRNNVMIAQDTVIENAFAGYGDDVLIGNPANNRLYGGYAGDDMLFGRDGNDQLWGRSGDDVLRGDGGDDELIGGLGSDLLIGGLGNDTFVFSPIDGNYQDHIADFRTGNNVIDVSAFDNINSFDDILGRYFWYDESQTSSYIDLTEYGGGWIVLEGYTDSIYDTDFIFHDDTLMA